MTHEMLFDTLTLLGTIKHKIKTAELDDETKGNILRKIDEVKDELNSSNVLSQVRELTREERVQEIEDSINTRFNHGYIYTMADLNKIMTREHVLIGIDFNRVDKIFVVRDNINDEVVPYSQNNYNFQKIGEEICLKNLTES